MQRQITSEQEWPEHSAVLAANESGDPRAAAEEMRLHLTLFNLEMDAADFSTNNLWR